jgi:hypothetical protein
MMIAALVELARTIVIMRHMHQRKVVSDNEWTGWLRRMRSCFEQGKIREYWQSGLELEKWFDPAFINIITQTAIYHNDNKYMQNRYSEQVILTLIITIIIVISTPSTTIIVISTLEEHL